LPPNKLPVSNRLIDLHIESSSFEAIYLDHFVPLHRYAATIVNDQVIAEEMVHQVFWKLLERKEDIQIQISLKAYLYRSVHYECLNHLKHEKVKQTYTSDAKRQIEDTSSDLLDRVQYKELERQIKLAINELPEQCRTIFQLSRFEDLKYAEIASQLGLSVKTIETQMSRALKKLRIQLSEYLPLVIWMLMNLLKYKR
jgi:RNA polymerase sigma-70 factor (ECF subfamily)